MEKQISFSEGLVSVPYSDVSPDGQCSELHGLEVYTGSLKPCLVKGSEITDIDGRLLFIHKTNQYIHYIYRKDSKIGYYEKQADGNVNVEFGEMKDIGDFTDLSASGNILLFLRENDEPYAYLWDEGEYKNLGTMPELEMQFSLVPYVPGGPVVAVIKDDENESDRFDKIVGMYNDVERTCDKGGCFVFPFFARAAYKTFDGKYIKQTTPVLMMPNTLLSIERLYDRDGNIVYHDPIDTEGISNEDKPYAYYLFCTTYKLYADLLTVIPGAWKPIIQSVDIFITPPLYPFDTSVKKSMRTNIMTEVYNVQISKRGNMLNQDIYHTYRRRIAETTYMIPYMTPDEALDKSGQLGFVKVNSYGLTQDINNIVNLKEGDYNALAAKQTDVLNNDYMTHDKIAAKSAFVYNKRTSLYNSKVIRYWGAGEERYQRSDYLEPIEGQLDPKKEYEVYEVVYEGGEKRLRYICDYFADYLHWWYCQNQNVKSIIVRNGDYCDEIDLMQHTFWGGVAYINIEGYELDFRLNWAEEYSPFVTEERIVDDKPNTIYTSAADNPFLYENVGETVVGTGTILKLATMTTILSEGQAGQFDMIALTDIGNYALTIIKTGENAGLIQYITPMRPDVCINKDSVCQDEGGIVIATANGLVLLTSNNTERLSDKLKGVAESEDESKRTVTRPSARPKDTPTLIAQYDIQTNKTLTPINQEYTFPSRRANSYRFVLRPCDGYAVDATYSLIINREYGPGGVVNVGQTIADDISFSNGIAQEYVWESDRDNIDTLLRLVYKSGNPTTPARNFITLEIYPADNNFNRYDTYNTEGYHEVKPIGYVDSKIIGLGGPTDIKYKLKAEKKYIMVLDLRNTIESLSKPIMLNAQIGQNVIEDRMLYFDNTFKDRIVVYSFENQTADDMAFLSFDIPNSNVTVGRLAGEYATVQLWEEDDEDSGGGGGGEDDDDDDETWKDDYPMDDVDLTAIPPMQFLNECKILKDVVNNRLLITAVGCSEYYQLSLDGGAWNTASFHKNVKVILNTYPFSYIQFDDNHIIRIDRDEKILNGQDENLDVYNGLLITRPVKMDSLLLKRITEFALQGNFEERQRLTIWGSNDLKHWFKLGTTERRRVGAMRGYYFKYWRFAIETKLKENENISGLLVRYDTKNDGRFR